MSILTETGLVGGTKTIDGALQGTWTPFPVGLTVVGSVNYTGTWTRIGRLVHWTITIAPVDAGTTTSTGAPYFNNAPFTAGEYASFCVINEMVVGLGTGLVGKASTYIVLPTWSITNCKIFMSGTYII